MRPQGTVLALEDVTSIDVGADSALWVGTSGDAFFKVTPEEGTILRFECPNPTGEITYCLYPLGDERFMVARRNNGVTLVSSTADAGGQQVKSVRPIVMPSGSIPDKGLRYSVYNIVKADSIIFLGTSNGLTYLSERDLATTTDGTDTITCRYVMPLKHLRDNRLQFAQEAIFSTPDAIITVTDNGIHTVRYDEISKADPAAATLIDSGRYWSAVVNRDTLYALRTDPSDLSSYQLCAYPLPLTAGMQPQIRRADPATAGLGLYNGKVVALNASDASLPDADYHLRHSCTEIGNHFYYIESGRLMRAESDRAPDDLTAEHITHDIGTHVLTDHHGIWRRDGDHFRYIGRILNPVPVKDATYSAVTDSIYIVSHSGIYAVDAGRTILPSDRALSMAYPNTPGDADRIESILADDNRLYIGSRNGLKSIDLTTRAVYNHAFDSLARIYESPYVNAIHRVGNGTLEIGTLNFGKWLMDKQRGTLTHVGPLTPAPRTDATGKIITDPRGTTWQQVRRAAWIIALILCALIGAVTMVIWAIRRIHLRNLRQIKSAKVERYAALASSFADFISRHEAEQAFAPIISKLTPSVKAINNFCDDPGDEQRAEADKEVTALVHTLETEVIDNAVRLVSHFPEDAPGSDDIPSGQLWGAMTKFRDAVMEMSAKAKGGALKTTIASALSIYESYRRFIERGESALLAIHREGLPAHRDFTPAALAKLWDMVMLLDVTKAIDPRLFPIYYSDTLDANGLEISGYCARMVFVTLTFYNQAKPSVEGYDSKDLRYATRAVYNFNPKPDRRGYNNHGSAYKIIVRAMSEGYALADDRTKPLVSVRLADILWDRYFSRMTSDIKSLRPDPDQVKSLREAIIGAARLAASASKTAD